MKYGGGELTGYKVLGGLKTLYSLERKPHVIIAMANCKVKKVIVEKLQGNFNFITISHPSVRVSKIIEVEQETLIYPGVILTVNTTIGNHVLLVVTAE